MISSLWITAVLLYWCLFLSVDSTFIVCNNCQQTSIVLLIWLLCSFPAWQYYHWGVVFILYRRGLILLVSKFSSYYYYYYYCYIFSHDVILTLVILWLNHPFIILSKPNQFCWYVLNNIHLQFHLDYYSKLNAFFW